MLTVVSICMATEVKAQQPAPKKAMPDFKFESKSYQVDCYDKTKGGCQKLIEHLKSLGKPQERNGDTCRRERYERNETTTVHT